MQNIVPVLSRTRDVKIGEVTYIVTSHFKENGRETAEQKLERYVQNRIEDELKIRINL